MRTRCNMGDEHQATKYVGSKARQSKQSKQSIAHSGARQPLYVRPREQGSQGSQGSRQGRQGRHGSRVVPGK